MRRRTGLVIWSSKTHLSSRVRAAPALVLLALLAYGAVGRAAEGDTDAPAKNGAGTDASAKEPVAEAPKDEHDAGKAGNAESTGHGMQFGVRVGLALGYKMDFRYDRSPLCHPFDPSKSASDQQKVCGFGAPPGLEVALSFALLDGIEPYVFGRFGFSRESDTDTKALQLYGVGLRIYTMSDSHLKIYIEPAIALEVEGGAGNPAFAVTNPSYKNDFVFHAAAGPQYDFNKYFGAFLNAGLDVGVLRSINATLLANLGVQARFP
jgi:hypothetical protein